LLCAAQEIARFLRNPRKPVILAMSRPDAKKNITTLVKAFGENPTLRELANLVLIMVRRARLIWLRPPACCCRQERLLR
jgi:sucrose-phosphate synthase